MKKILTTLTGGASAVLVILFLLISSFALSRPVLEDPQSTAVFSSKASADSYGSFSPTVIDGRTDQPIENAVIVIPETGEQYKTDADGKTGEIRVPILKDARFSDIHEKSWGEITLLVYADGYAPYALFYLQITEKILRDGPTVMLFPGNQKPFSIIEGPPDQWSSELLDKYRP